MAWSLRDISDPCFVIPIMLEYMLSMITVKDTEGGADIG